MKNTINYTEARQIWDKYLKTEYLRKHTRESEVIMRKLAQLEGEDQEKWGIIGLLHDLDMDVINGDYALHGLKTVELLQAEGFDIPDVFAPILAHTEGVEGSVHKRQTRLDYILAAAENITGIISAYVLMRPDKKIEGTTVKSIKKRIKTKSFAAGVNRRFMADITDKAGIEQQIFIQAAIDAMTEIADELGM